MAPATFRGRPWRWARDEIARLDPERDADRIVHLLFEVRFGDPYFVTAGHAITFARQAAVPSIAAILDRGGRGDSVVDARNRYDDTMLFFGELYRLGTRSDAGRRVLERLNAIHSRFPITNDDMRYTLATVVFEPVRLSEAANRAGYTDHEIRAIFTFWREAARTMQIADVHETPAALRGWMEAYEAEHYRHTAGGRRVADALVRDFAERWYPRPLRQRAELGLVAAFGPQLRAAHGYPEPKRSVRAGQQFSSRAYMRRRDLLPDPPERTWRGTFPTVYPPGWTIEDLGPQRA